MRLIIKVFPSILLIAFLSACGSSGGDDSGGGRETPTRHSLNISLHGAGGGTATSDPVGINCGTDCNEDYAEDTVVTLTATPDANSIFDGWSGDADCGDGSVTLSTDINCVATFSPVSTVNTFTLSITANPGTGSGSVTSNPAGIDCGNSCSHDFDEGAQVILTATPAAGSEFVAWGGDADCEDGSVTLNDDVLCHPNFKLIPRYTLTIGGSSSDGSGTVTSLPLGIDCGADCSEVFAENTTVILTATPDVGSAFRGWIGDTACEGSMVTMTRTITCYPVFDRLPIYTLTISTSGTGTGSVTSSPVGIDCGADCTEDYIGGTTVIMTATADPGSEFAGWTGDAICADGVQVNADVTCNAVFNLIPPATHLLEVTVIHSNGAEGNVSSDPAGINCGNGGSDCLEDYTEGSTVTLTATPATGSEFIAWGGDADCEDGIVTMSTPTSCIAVFDLVPYTLNATFTPVTASRIGNTETISISFNETVNQATLTLNGDLAPESAAVNWIDAQTVNITPTGVWTKGRDRALAVSIEDALGRVLDNVGVIYDVAIVYASVDHAAASDINPGTKELPFANLRSALDYANSNFSESEIHVALGTYAVDGTSPTTRLELANNVSLYGGYSMDWLSRDPEANFTSLINSATNFGVRIQGNNHSITIDGFMISAGQLADRVMLIFNSNPIISNNILSSEASTLDSTYVIYIDGDSTPDIDHNIILNSNNASLTRSIYIWGTSNARIRNNTIFAGGNGNTGSTALRIAGASGATATATVYNNILVGGDHTTSYALASSSPTQHFIINNTIIGYRPLLIEDNAAVIENNILHSTGYPYCIDEPGIDSAGALPTSLENNNFYGCSSLARFYQSTSITIDTLDDFSTLLGISATGSVVLQPVYENEALDNYLIANTSANAITRGGKNRSDLFTTDINQVARTIPWSMGANEVDDGINTPPIADAGPDQFGYAGLAVTLDASASNDSDTGDTIYYAWSFSEVPTGSSITDADLSDANAQQPEFTPDVLGNYVLNLIVSDGFESGSDTVTINVIFPIYQDASVSDIQSGVIQTNTGVQLSNVVVTAIDNNRQNLWVADDVAANEYNGIYIYRGTSASPLAGEIQIGARINLTGIANEFNTLTQIALPEITYLAPPSDSLTPVLADISTLENSVSGEAYEGVLVRIENVVTSETDINGKFTVFDFSGFMFIDDHLYGYPATLNECLASITGIINWNWLDNRFEILPRTNADIATGGTCL